MKKRAVIIGFSTALAVVGAFFGWRESSAEIYRTFQSPDERYRVEVWRYPEFYAAPGDSGGAPGFVRLVDSVSEKTVQRKATEMVMLIDSVRWNSYSVDIKLFVEWPLPK